MYHSLMNTCFSFQCAALACPCHTIKHAFTHMDTFVNTCTKLKLNTHK